MHCRRVSTPWSSRATSPRTGREPRTELALAFTSGRADRSFFIAGNHDDPGVMDDVLGTRDDFRLIRLSDRWTIGLLNTQWIGHDAGRIPAAVLESVQEQIRNEDTNVVLCLHHPPISPCSQPDCGLLEPDLLLDLLRGSPVRVVLSGHVHQQFETVRHDVIFLGAPSTFRQLRHGGVPHYEDTGEPPAAHLLELSDDGAVSCRVVPAG